MHCSLCFTLKRFLFFTDVVLRNLIYVLRSSTIYASVRLTFFDVASHASLTQHVGMINNEQKSISKCERGFVGANRVHRLLIDNIIMLGVLKVSK